jgi:hypothetical protein
MNSKSDKAPPRYRAIHEANVERAAELKRLPEDIREAVRVISRVLPFRTNAYVMKELIRWENVPDDPIFQLTFPQRGMLSEEEFDRMARLLRKEALEEEIQRVANNIRFELNPHPAGQQTDNVPSGRARRCPVRSTSIVRRCCSFAARDRLATRTACSASVGRNSSASTN